MNASSPSDRLPSPPDSGLTDAPSGSVSTAPTDRSPTPRKAPRVLLVLISASLVMGGVLWLVNRGKQSTDDAQIEAHMVTVSVRTAGQIARVLVADNQSVKQGDILVELDLDELKARMGAARADRMAAEASLALAQSQLALTERTSAANIRQARGGVSQANSGVESSKAQLEQTQADISAAQSRQQLSEKELNRIRELFAQGTVSQAELDGRQAAADQSNAGLELAKARYESTRAAIVGNYGGVEQAQGRLGAALTAPQQVESAQAQVQLGQARVEQARAAERLAELNLSYGIVRAPVSGVVSRKNVEPGNLVSPDRPVLSLVALDDVWVVANFKEDQVGVMKAGQSARIEIDSFSGHACQGHVESIAAATGARFALLPPDNATGNFVKVVQRIPVRLKLDNCRELTLRPGMSATVTVRVP